MLIGKDCSHLGLHNHFIVHTSYTCLMENLETSAGDDTSSVVKLEKKKRPDIRISSETDGKVRDYAEVTGLSVSEAYEKLIKKGLRLKITHISRKESEEIKEKLKRLRYLSRKRTETGSSTEKERKGGETQHV